ncbi:actin-depolymerizing factor ADF6 [Capsaspora owczarzaki ATCC 30864]|uniref:Actin-depolymerizing factor ADF6 n=1 Tax=Capsaspora owczarzaki (strain ATCC 30864) TaxID=595528 RepID=A0A0D2VLA7_CAPO3|nr:actin-depolymerizing factor ADF6 [Capsaspora owczarzaki ATCC 30864]KJE90892.1 actin-depolymerizing factor ADF6 [Capsaspora owczarzaki ATCC 30864]|eukprot:XP_004348877.1 actin-depolymerizing factor ADF6 [Capsaspora owczarzaki ATCC 30864]
MASGVKVDPEVATVFQDLKLKHTYRYVIFQLNSDNTMIVITKKADPSATYDEFLAELPPNDCRYAVYDLAYDTPESGKREKLVFFAWAPNESKIKQKMLYASSKDALKAGLVGLHAEIQATDASEVDYSYIIEKLSSRDR